MENLKKTQAFNSDTFFPRMEKSLKCGFFLINVDQMTCSWSKGSHEIFGTPAETDELCLDYISKFIDSDEVTVIKQKIKNGIKKYKKFKIEFSFFKSIKKFKRIRIEFSPISDDVTGNKGFQGLVLDISENFKIQQKLEAEIKKLDKSNKNLQEFTYVSSHDLQEPLRKITTFSERLSAKYKDVLGEEGGRYIERIASSCQSMRTLLDDLLDYSKLSNQTIFQEQLNLDKLLTAVLSDLEIPIKENKVKLDLCVNHNILGYQTQLRQLFTNLIQNSIKFRRLEQDSIIKISCSSASKEEIKMYKLKFGRLYLKIEFEDNGIGFEKEYSEKIFHVFQRLNGKAEYKGSGIGLSICRKIVDNHQGHIFAEGRLNEGAKFTILLPENLN
jgi:signal transduction histidine kinase